MFSRRKIIMAAAATAAAALCAAPASAATTRFLPTFFAASRTRSFATTFETATKTAAGTVIIGTTTGTATRRRNTAAIGPTSTTGALTNPRSPRSRIRIRETVGTMTTAIVRIIVRITGLRPSLRLLRLIGGDPSGACLRRRPAMPKARTAGVRCGLFVGLQDGRIAVLE